jgi:hypothetical protein
MLPAVTLLRSIRNRALLIGLAALLVGIWVMKSAFHLAGAAIKFVLVIAAILIAISWITSKVGKGSRR